MLQGVFYSLTRVLGRRRFAGNEVLGRSGAALVVANHISHIDPLFDAVYVRKAGRFPHILAKSSLWKVPVLKSVLNRTGQIPVERGGGAGGTALDAATKALGDGKIVVIYPEGTVSREPDHWPMRPRPGVAVLALAGDFPVIPVVHWGTQALYASYQAGFKLRPFPRKDIHVVAGPPIDLSAWRGKPVDARAIRDVSYLIMNTIKDMLADVRGERPPPTCSTRRRPRAGMAHPRSLPRPGPRPARPRSGQTVWPPTPRAASPPPSRAATPPRAAATPQRSARAPTTTRRRRKAGLRRATGRAEWARPSSGSPSSGPVRGERRSPRCSPTPVAMSCSGHGGSRWLMRSADHAIPIISRCADCRSPFARPPTSTTPSGARTVLLGVPSQAMRENLTVFREVLPADGPWCRSPRASRSVPAGG